MTPKVVEWRSAFDHSLDIGVPNHEHIRILARHSRTVSFLMRLRPGFITEFGKYKKDFPEVHDVEGLFLQTVVRSLDHNVIASLMPDPLFLDETHPDFGGMGELLQMSRAAFVDDLPFLPFNPKIEGQVHPFYRAVHARAMKIDPKLATGLDACIIK